MTDDRVVDQVQVALEVDVTRVVGAALAVERRGDLAATRPVSGVALELGLAIVPSQCVRHARRQVGDLGLDGSRSVDGRRAGRCAG